MTTQPGNRVPHRAKQTAPAAADDEVRTRTRPRQGGSGLGGPAAASTHAAAPAVAPAPAPARPTAAERARTLAEGSSSSYLTIPGLTIEDPLSMEPTQRMVTSEGDVMVRLPVSSPAVRAVRHARGDEVTAVLEITDVAPVAVADRVRGRGWIAGWLTPARDGSDQGWLKLEVGEVHVEDVWGADLVEPDDFAAAEADPLAGYETDLLQHLDAGHAEELHRLCALIDRRRLPFAWPTNVVPLALDRYGLRVRFSDGHSTFDARFQFPDPVVDVVGLQRTVQGMFAEAWQALQRHPELEEPNLG